MTTNADPRLLAAGLAELISRVENLALDYGADVARAVAAATFAELPVDAARRLFTRLLTVLETATGDHPDLVKQRVEAAVAGVLTARAVPAATEDGPAGPSTGEAPQPDGATPLPTGGIFDRLRSRHGLRPHWVTPVPSFNDVPVPMVEGYVDVAELSLWQENHRVELHVREFEERNHRRPDPDEMLAIMQGTLHLPSLTERDPFNVVPLAQSIARKGVERPPILTWDGEPKDGNRRIAAAKYVVAGSDTEFDVKAKTNARYLRVWVAPSTTPEEDVDAVVVALNFEPDLKEEWPEYVKAGLVVDRYRALKSDVQGVPSPAVLNNLKRNVAKHFAIKTNDVTRYLNMVQWAEDFETYHVDEQAKDPASVRYKTEKIFQWFYEVQAGKQGEKLTGKLEQDEHLRQVVYDLMFDVLESGAEVRALYKVVADDNAMEYLKRAHDTAETSREQAHALVLEAIAETKRNSPTARLGFEQFVRSVIDRFGATPPDQWREVDTALLPDLRRVLVSAIGAIDGLLGEPHEREANQLD